MCLMLIKLISFKLFFLIAFTLPIFSNSQNIPKAISKPEIIKKKYSELFLEIKKQNWQIAKSIASDYNDKNLITLVEWLNITRPGSKHSFNYLVDFLKNNPNWPLENKIKKKIESSIVSSDNPKEILEWFKINKPLTVKGSIDYLESRLALGLNENKKKLIQDIWINKNLTYSQQNYFIRKYSKYWDQDHNWKRFDRLMWEGKTVSARKTLRRIKGDLRNLGNARLALSVRAPNVSNLIKKVPLHLKNDPGLLYERMRWRRKAKLETAQEFLINPPEVGILNERNWWINARIVIRRLINKKEYSKAYKLLKNHNIPISTISGTEAEWLAGWIALSFLKKPDLASDHFGVMFNNVKHPRSKSKAAYWMSESIKASKNKNNKTYMEWLEVSSKYKYSFYGQKASLKLKNFSFEKKDYLYEKPPGTEHLMEAIKILTQAGHERKIDKFLMKAFEMAKTDGQKNYVLRYALKLKNKDLLIKIDKIKSQKSLIFSYPEIKEKVPKKFISKKDLALIHAITLQESAFKINAYSHAGARGLMQLMPFTAKRVAQSLKIKYYRKALTTNPEYNILLGTTYIKGLLKDFDNCLPLALAGYNAGPGRVKIWLKRYGDPRKNQISYVDWIESIPIFETRNYVKKVIANYRIYEKKFGIKKITENYFFGT